MPLGKGMGYFDQIISAGLQSPSKQVMKQVEFVKRAAF
jgi:hypothetical protein